jgi:hypothetical protein
VYTFWDENNRKYEQPKKRKKEDTYDRNKNPNLPDIRKFFTSTDTSKPVPSKAQAVNKQNKENIKKKNQEQDVNLTSLIDDFFSGSVKVPKMTGNTLGNATSLLKNAKAVNSKKNSEVKIETIDDALKTTTNNIVDNNQGNKSIFDISSNNMIFKGKDKTKMNLEVKKAEEFGLLRIAKNIDQTINKKQIINKNKHVSQNTNKENIASSN